MIKPFGPRARGREGRAAKVRVDARGEDARVEWLGDVVVGADLEADDLVHLVRAPGQHHHRAHQALAAELEDDLGAADVRQHPVDENEVGLGRTAELDRVGAGRRLERVVALLAADLGDERPDRTVVLDHQHASLASCGRLAQVSDGGANPTRLASC